MKAVEQSTTRAAALHGEAAAALAALPTVSRNRALAVLRSLANEHAPKGPVALVRAAAYLLARAALALVTVDGDTVSAVEVGRPDSTPRSTG